LDWFEEVYSPLVADLLHRWPTLPDLQRARSETIRSFCWRHNCRDAERIEERIRNIRQTIPPTRDAAKIQPAVAMTRTAVDLIATLRAGIAELEQQIATTTTGLPDFMLFDSFPGAGAALALRLSAAFGSCRDRYATAADVQKLNGIAPTRKHIGKTASVSFPPRLPKSLRQTFHEWAGHSIAFCDWARASYQHQRQHRTRPSCCRPSACVQVDPHRLPLLAGWRAL